MTLAALLSVAIYIAIVHSQNGLPQWWVLALMVVVTIGAAIGVALRQRRIRRVALLAATVIAAALGLLSLFSVGGPLILTAALGLVAMTTDSSQPPRARRVP